MNVFFYKNPPYLIWPEPNFWILKMLCEDKQPYDPYRQNTVDKLLI